MKLTDSERNEVEHLAEICKNILCDTLYFITDDCDLRQCGEAGKLLGRLTYLNRKKYHLDSAAAEM